MNNIKNLSDSIFGDFYSPRHILSYNKHWMISVGSRSIGKSTGWMIYAIYRYLRFGERFIYLRRTDDEVKRVASNCCDSAVYILKRAGFPIVSIIAQRGYFYIQLDDQEEKEVCGCYFSLSQAYKNKSANYGALHYNLIIYDEFITTDVHKYLGSREDITYEYDKCVELYVTVDRDVDRPFRNETKFVFIANLASYYNPIFIGLGADRYIRTDSRIVSPKGTNWIIEQTTSVKATEEYKKSVGYSLAREDRKSYAYENRAFDETSFVKVIKAPLFPLYNVKWNKDVFGVYTEPNAGIIYISKKPTQLMTIALTLSGYNEIDYGLAKRPTDWYNIKELKNSFQHGLLYFESQRIRYIMANYFMLTA